MELTDRIADVLYARRGRQGAAWDGSRSSRSGGRLRGLFWRGRLRRRLLPIKESLHTALRL